MFCFGQKPTVVAVVLKMHMHCEACAQVIRKKILKMKGTILSPHSFQLILKSFVLMDDIIYF
jgi:hypothetical protein